MKVFMAFLLLGLSAAFASAAWAQDSGHIDVGYESHADPSAKPPCPPEKACEQSQKLTPVLPNQALETEEKYEVEVRQMIDGSRFDSLDKEADRVRASKQRTVGGVWKLYLLYEVISAPIGGDNSTEFSWTSRLEQLKNWVTARPQSITAHVALAQAYLGYAWFARGNGYADSVSDSDWKLFNARLAQASNTLKEAQSLSAKCPHFYNVTLLLARAQGWPLEAMRQVFDRAIAYEPAYYHTYREFAYTLMPQWSGQEGDAEAFAEESLQRIGGREGAFVYFELASLIYCQCGTPTDHPILSWPKIQEGFAVLEQNYGASSLKLNRFAALAYLYKDQTVGKRALQRVGDNWEMSAWGKRSTFDAARAWAQPEAGNPPAQSAAVGTAVPWVVQPSPPTSGPEFAQWQADMTAAQQAQASNQSDQAEALYRKALQEAEHTPELYAYQALPNTLRALGSLYLMERKIPQAEEALRRQLEVYDKLGGRGDPEAQSARQTLTTVYMMNRDYKSAEVVAAEMVDIAEHNPPAGSDPYISQALDLLGSIYYGQLDFGKAQPLYEQALALDEKLQGPDSIVVASRLDHLAALYRAEGAFDKAEPLFRRELDLDEMRNGKSSPAIEGALAQMADILKKMGRREEAAQYQQRWDDIQKSLVHP
jgi:tetratricopeptide (TPR) repeat protein